MGKVASLLYLFSKILCLIFCPKTAQNQYHAHLSPLRESELFTALALGFVIVSRLP